jgi:hypothetical protein
VALMIDLLEGQISSRDRYPRGTDILEGQKVEYQVASIAGDIKKAVRVTVPSNRSTSNRSKNRSKNSTSEKHTGTLKW